MGLSVLHEQGRVHGIGQLESDTITVTATKVATTKVTTTTVTTTTVTTTTVTTTTNLG